MDFANRSNQAVCSHAEVPSVLQARVQATHERAAALRERVATLNAEVAALQARENELQQQQQQQPAAAAVAQDEPQAACSSGTLSSGSEGYQAAPVSHNLDWNQIAVSALLPTFTSDKGAGSRDL